MLSKYEIPKDDKSQVTPLHADWSGKWYDFFLYLPERWVMSKWRRVLWRNLEQPTKRLLEIGVGTGNNFKHYPPNTEVWAIDINSSMLQRARQKLRHAPTTVHLLLADVESLPFTDSTFDTVVATFVFCNVPDPVQGFREIARVLKPGGRAYFLEHMIPHTPWKAKLFDRLNPLVFRTIGDHINRRTVDNVVRAGLEIERVISVTRDGVVRLIVAKSLKGGEG